MQERIAQGFPENQLRAKPTLTPRVFQLEHSNRILAQFEIEFEETFQAEPHKDKAEKAVQKVTNEFRRYVNDLENNVKNANPTDLLSALVILEAMVGTLKVR